MGNRFRNRSGKLDDDTSFLYIRAMHRPSVRVCASLFAEKDISASVMLVGGAAK